MGLASFQRMRRLAEAMDVQPAPGKNLRETISDQLKARGIAHSLVESKGLARAVRETETDRLAAEETPTGLPGSILNTREMAADAERRRADADASVVMTGGRVVGSQGRRGRNAHRSAEHYAPPTSTNPGTGGVPPVVDAEKVRAEEERRRLAAEETEIHAQEKRAKVEDEEDRREELSESTANQGDRRAAQREGGPAADESSRPSREERRTRRASRGKG